MTHSDFLWLALTVYYEARGEPTVGMKAVTKVIMNRARRKNKSIKQIVLKPMQFSCYNGGLASEILKIRELPTFIKVADTVQEAMAEWEGGDNLGGADHYYALAGMKGNKPPSWAAGMRLIIEINNHRFYKET